MSSRFSAARPKRAGETFARTHHAAESEDSPSSSKKPRFDIRNPSALAPDVAEGDAILEADVIGGSGAGTKRGAVNLDGYDSDSENEVFDARAEARAKNNKGKGEVSLADALDGYTKDGRHKAADREQSEMEEDADMFAELDDDLAGEDGDGEISRQGKKHKVVKFLEVDEIEGQVENSKSGGHISGNFALDPNGKLSTHAMDDQQSSDDEEDIVLAAQEEDVDEEVGAAGRKRNAPKVDAFNMRAEQEEGRFDDAGNFVRKAVDPDAKHDSWLEGVNKKAIKKAAEAHERREAERRQKILENDVLLLPDILKTLILQLEKGETALEALARLGKIQSKTKKTPKWKLKKQKQNGNDAMDVDAEEPTQCQERARIKDAINTITVAADQLFTRGQTDIYEQEREMLIRQYRREAGEDWVEPPAANAVGDSISSRRPVKMWEYRWTDGRDGDTKQGPFDGPTMMAWQAAGYFGEGVEFKQVDDEGRWDRIVDFV